MNVIPFIMLGIIIGVECDTEEIYIQTPEGEQLLTGYAVHDEFLAYLNKFIREKLKDSTTSIMNFSKISFSDLFSTINAIDYIFIQILHALSNENIIVSNFLGELTMNYYGKEEIIEISNFIRNSIKFPVDKGLKVVRALMIADRKELIMIPRPIVKEILLLVDVTAIISKALETGEIEIAQWLLKANIDFNSHPVLETALAKENIDIAMLLIKNGALDDLLGRENLSNLHFGKEGTLLHLASQSHRPRAVAALLAAGAEVDAIDSEGWSPLHRAVESKDRDAVILLVNHEANMNKPTPTGDLPLHLAVYNADLAMTKLLIKLGSKLDQKNQMGLTPIHVAENMVVSSLLRYIDDNIQKNCSMEMSCSQNTLDGILYEDTKKFLENSNRREIFCQRTDLPLTLTMSEIVNVFLRKGEVTRLTSHLELLLSTKIEKLGNNDLSEILVNLGYVTPDINIEPILDDIEELNAEFLSLDENIKWKNRTGHTYLHVSAANGDLKGVKMLVKKGANIEAKTENNWTPLHFAANEGHEEVATLLLENKAQVNAETSNKEMPLHLASANGHTEVVKILLVNGALINGRTSHCLTPLYLASIGGHIEVVEELVDNDAYINAKDCSKYNLTPLQAAIFQSHLNVGEYLLEQGADIDSRDKAGNTMLFSFVWHGDLEKVNTLLKWGADPKLSVGSQGLTPLHAAAAQGNHEMIPILLSAGADINAVTVDGMTPLYIAVLKGHSEVFKALLTQGANIYQNGPNGETILSFALRKGMIKLGSH